MHARFSASWARIHEIVLTRFSRYYLLTDSKSLQFAIFTDSLLTNNLYMNAALVRFASTGVNGPGRYIKDQVYFFGCLNCWVFSVVVLGVPVLDLLCGESGWAAVCCV